MRHLAPRRAVTGADLEGALRSFAAGRIRLSPGEGRARGLVLRTLASLSISASLMPVEVCGALSWFVHATLEPAETVTVSGM